MPLCQWSWFYIILFLRSEYLNSIIFRGMALNCTYSEVVDLKSITKGVDLNSNGQGFKFFKFQYIKGTNNKRYKCYHIKAG